MLARWEYAESDDAMAEALAAIPHDLDWRAKGTLRVVGGPQVLLSAADPGMDPVLPRLELDLVPGTYEVGWVRYSPEPRTAAGLIRLRRVD